jgi:hypothetical protein
LTRLFYRQTLNSNENTEYVPILDEEAAITVAKLKATNEALKNSMLNSLPSPYNIIVIHF